MIITILTFIILLAILVFVHEFGHFYVAKKSGMLVEEFGFGFPPRIVGIQKVDGRLKFIWRKNDFVDREKTVYSINWIPLGGFVRILGENNEHEEDPRSFINRPFWVRFFTLVAGVTMNVILAWVLLSVGFMINLPAEVDVAQPPAHAIVSNPRVVVGGILPNDPAEKAGLMPNDVVLSIDGKTFSGGQDLINYVRSHKDQTITFHVQRENEQKDITVTPTANPDNKTQGFIGAEMANVANLRYPWYYAIGEGAAATWYGVANVALGLYGLITGHISLSNVGGPVAIAKLTGQAARTGFMAVLQLTAILSVNLAFLNILPFPALDGGRVLFLIIEKIRRKRNNQQVEQFVNTAGFVFLLLLMVVVTIKDIVKK